MSKKGKIVAVFRKDNSALDTVVFAFRLLGLDKVIDDGGPGSGNWGHKGRPGKVGGSGKGGGKQYRGGRGDIKYVGSREDWLNGLAGEKQHEAQRWKKQMRQHYSIGAEKEKSVEQCIMEDRHSGSEKIRTKLLNYMAEARGWDEHAGKLIDENLTDDEKRLVEQLGYKYGLQFVGNVGLPDDNETSAWDKEDLEFWQDMKSKAMDGPTSGVEPPDELQYSAGLKERPKPAGTVWSAGNLKNEDNLDTAEFGVEHALGRYVELSKVGSKEELDQIEHDMFARIYEVERNYQIDRGIKVYLKAKIAEAGGLSYDTFTKEMNDRLTPLEQSTIQQVLWRAKRNNEDVLESLDYDDQRPRMEAYAVINKMLGGADLTDFVRQKNADQFRKEQEQRAQEIRERAERKLEEERQRQEAERKRAPVIEKAKAAIKDDGLLPAINEAQTVADVAKAISGAGMFTGDRAADFGKITNLGIAKSCATAYSDTMQSYPFLVGKIAPPTLETMGRDTIAACYMGSGQVTFNTSYYGMKDDSKLNDAVRRGIETNFHPQGATDYQSFAIHELGHAIECVMLRELRTKGKFYAVDGRDSISYKLRERVFQKMGLGRYTKEKTLAHISGYAAHDSNEWFAECFAEARCSKDPRPMAKAFMEELTAFIRDNGFEGGLNDRN